MSETHTIVVRFPEGADPRYSYSCATEFQGGRVVAVDFDGNRLLIARELEEALDELLQLVETERPDWQHKEQEMARAALKKARGE